MRQEVSPKLVIAVIAVVVVVVGVFAFRFWRTTAARSASTGIIRPNPQQGVHGAPSPTQMQEIQEWKKTHPGAFTTH